MDSKLCLLRSKVLPLTRGDFGNLRLGVQRKVHLSAVAAAEEDGLWGTHCQRAAVTSSRSEICSGAVPESTVEEGRAWPLRAFSKDAMETAESSRQHIESLPKSHQMPSLDFWRKKMANYLPCLSCHEYEKRSAR